MKKILVCMHGLMNHNDHDIHYFKEYIDQYLEKDEEVRLAFLYNHADHKSYSYKRQVKSLDTLLEDLFNQGYEVSLLGYSYSASFVARFSKKYDFHRVILIAPTYEIFSRGMISNYLHVLMKSWKMRWKYRNNPRAKDKMKKANLNHIVSLVLNVYKSLIVNKKNYKNIKAPCLMFKGTSDTLVTPIAYIKCAKSISSTLKDIRLIDDYSHTFIRHLDECVEKTSTWNDIYNFVFKD